MKSTMSKSEMTEIQTALRKTDAMLAQQATEIATLKATASIQFRRIADIQAELDVLPRNRQRRRTLLARHHSPQVPVADRRSERE
jgi:hypothetical protein